MEYELQHDYMITDCMHIDGTETVQYLILTIREQNRKNDMRPTAVRNRGHQSDRTLQTDSLKNKSHPADRNKRKNKEVD